MPAPFRDLRWGNFLRAVMRHRDHLKDNLTDQQLQ